MTERERWVNKTCILAIEKECDRERAELCVVSDVLRFTLCAICLFLKFDKRFRVKRFS